RKWSVRCAVSGATHRTGQSALDRSPTMRSTRSVAAAGIGTAMNNRQSASVDAGSGGRSFLNLRFSFGMTASIGARPLDASPAPEHNSSPEGRTTMATAFLGPRGTFSEDAALLYAGTGELIDFTSIPALTAAVETGLAIEAVLPIENSIEGQIGATLDLLIHE